RQYEVAAGLQHAVDLPQRVYRVLSEVLNDLTPGDEVKRRIVVREAVALSIEALADETVVFAKLRAVDVLFDRRPAIGRVPREREVVVAEALEQERDVERRAPKFERAPTLLRVRRQRQHAPPERQTAVNQPLVD